MASKYKIVADVLEHKNGQGHYVRVKETIPAGTILQMQDPRALVAFLAEKGYIKEEDVEERLSKIPNFLAAQLVIRPEKK